MVTPAGDESLIAASARLQRATGTALKSIAIDALALGEGETLPKGDAYREALGVGAGTVQQAFQILASADAMRTQSHGHLGRRIVEVSTARLWHLADLPAVRFTLPPRGPLEVRAFAEFAAENLAAAGVPYAIDHHRGAGERIRAVRAGEADVAVVSSGVADELDHDEDMVAVPLAEGTYYAPGRLLVLGDRGKRVAIDPRSHDQLRLTELEFPAAEGFEYVEVDFPRVPVEILRGTVDTGIWHEMQTLISPALAGIRVAQPTRSAVLDLIERSSSATMLVSLQRPELRAALETLTAESLAARVRALADHVDRDPDSLDFAWTV